MLTELISLLNNYDSTFENRLSAGIDRFKKAFGAYFTSLEDKDDHYELVLDVAEDAKASNVKVDFDDETRELSVDYKYESKNCTSRSTIVETLPVDADEDSIEASVENGVLTILIGKKEVIEAEPEKEVDDTVVKINRKNRK